jgi:tRNA nucleotidyltransferase (CCA-adding enzyme)
MATDEPVWSHFPHSADVGIRGTGRTRAQAFEQAAIALFATVTDVTQIDCSSPVSIQCDAPNDRLLLVDWLNALIYESGVRKMVFGRFEVDIDDCHLTGRAWGESIDPSRHAIAVEPKNATFTELKVERAPDGLWIAQCVVDV